jgi:Na+-transporting NADH:ubiquinone oxidoreductase subunit NqrC
MPPPHAESHLYELGFMDMEHDGTTIYGIPTWFPKAETKAWEEARFRPRWHEVGRA